MLFYPAQLQNIFSLSDDASAVYKGYCIFGKCRVSATGINLLVPRRDSGILFVTDQSAVCIKDGRTLVDAIKKHDEL